MAHACEGGSSKRSAGDKMKESWKNESKTSHDVVGPSSYSLFPEPGHTNQNMGPLFNILRDQPQTNNGKIDMADAEDGGSSKRSFGDKMESWKEESKVSHDIVGSSLYRLFLEPGHTNHNLGSLFNTCLRDQPQIHGMLPNQVTQLPFEAMKQPTFLPEREDINANETVVGLNVQIQMSNHENNVPIPACGPRSWFLNAPATVQQAPQVAHINHGRCQSSYLTYRTPGIMEGNLQNFAEIMAVQKTYLCALNDPDQITPMKLLHKSPQALMNHYAHDKHRMSNSGAVTQQPQRISGSLQMQHSGWDDINHSGRVQQMMSSPMNNTFSIICVKGQIAGLCSNAHGSRLIQHALEKATPEEIIMVYEEVIPYARMLTNDVYGNHAVQKLLDHGHQFYKRKFLSNLIGYVLPLSLHVYGCRVIEKAFEVADHDLKVIMANEFRGKVLECTRDQYANHVLQKCMQWVPAQHIQFIFRSFCRKAKDLSITRYGCHVIQKVLTFCHNPQIYHTLVSEIKEATVKLASDPFGNYVVQHVVEHGGPAERSMIVKKLDGHVLSMSYNKYASNVIEKCLTFSSFQDRQLITDEILTTRDRQHFDHLLDMMCNVNANFVIQKLMMTAGEEQLRVLVEVAHRNVGTIMSYPHGKQFLDDIQKVLTERGLPLDIQGYVPGQSG